MVLVKAGDDDLVGLGAHVGDGGDLFRRHAHGTALPVEGLEQVVAVREVAVHAQVPRAVDVGHVEPGVPFAVLQDAGLIGLAELLILGVGEEVGHGVLIGQEDAVDPLGKEGVEVDEVGLGHGLQGLVQGVGVLGHQMEHGHGVQASGALLDGGEGIEDGGHDGQAVLVVVLQVPQDLQFPLPHGVVDVQHGQVPGIGGGADGVAFDGAAPHGVDVGERNVTAVSLGVEVTVGHDLDEIPLVQVGGGNELPGEIRHIAVHQRHVVPPADGGAVDGAPIQ